MRTCSCLSTFNKKHGLVLVAQLVGQPVLSGTSYPIKLIPSTCLFGYCSNTKLPSFKTYWLQETVPPF